MKKVFNQTTTLLVACTLLLHGSTVLGHDTGVPHTSDDVDVDTSIDQVEEEFKLLSFSSQEKTLSFTSRKAYTKVVDDSDESIEDESKDHEITDTWRKVALYSGLGLAFCLLMCFGVWWFCANTSG